MKQVDLNDTESQGKVLKDGKTLSQQVKSFEEAVALFLEEYKDSEHWPQAAVIGCAGPVDNNQVEFTNVIHWSVVDGTAISQSLDIPHFILINDFTAAGYGVLNLKEKDFIRMTDV